MNFGIERDYNVEPWKVSENDFNIERNKVAESIFSQSNEYMGTRGMYEEGLPSEDKNETLVGSYISGMFHKEKYDYVWKRKGFPDYGNYMSNSTNWIKMTVTVGGDETFSMATSDFSEYERLLDMQSGLLSRTLTFNTKKGKQTNLSFERFISFDDQHIGAIRLKLTPLNHDQKITISLYLDSSIGNQQYGYTEGATLFDQNADDNDIYLLNNISSTGQYYIHRMGGLATHNLEQGTIKYHKNDNSVACLISFKAKSGTEYIIDKLVSVWTSKDAGHPYGLIEKNIADTNVNKNTEKEIVEFLKTQSKENLDAYNETNSYNQLKEKHMTIMKDMWDKVDVEIKGDPLSQQGIRYCIFQLLCTYRGVDSYANIGAKGLTGGEHYMGRYFWDTESYCMPCYLFINPDAARNLIEYRYNTLEAAKKNAASFDYNGGAIYPWQTIDGSEDCIYWEYAYFEIHINAIVSYAIKLYTQITGGDTSFVYEKGISVLIEQSKFWSERVSWMPEKAQYGVLRVTGPDEYQQLVNNNYYTNFMVKETLDHTLEVIATMKEVAPELLEEAVNKAGLDLTDLDRWQDISDKMFLPENDTYKVFPQDDMFTTLEPKFKEDLDREKDIPAEAKWSIDRFTRYDMAKQPDVLLMMFLHRNRFSLEQKKNNFRFYEQRTVHGSSLSPPSIHSILASEIGRSNMAYEYYLWASRLDLDNYNNNSDKGLHISAMSGTWLNIIFGFGGMNVGGDCLEFNPSLPDQWEAYSFKIIYRDSVIKVSVDDKSATLEIPNGSPVDAIIYGQKNNHYQNS